jgi:hypothetical protein
MNTFRRQLIIYQGEEPLKNILIVMQITVLTKGDKSLRFAYLNKMRVLVYSSVETFGWCDINCIYFQCPNN